MGQQSKNKLEMDTNEEKKTSNAQLKQRKKTTKYYKDLNTQE